MLASDDVRIVVHERRPPRALVEAAADAYMAAFSEPPYFETSDDRAAFIDRVERYAARDGFRLVLANEDRSVLGLGLAVEAHPGDWWRDRVAERIGPAATERWLGPACLEVVHFAVRPDRQGEGIGGRLHDRLLEGARAGTAILSVHPAAAPARALYLGRGWRVLGDLAALGQGPAPQLMVRDL